MVTLPDLVDSVISPQMSSGCASVHLCQDVLNLAAGDGYLGRLPVDGLAVTFRHAVSMRGISTGPNRSCRLGSGH